MARQFVIITKGIYGCVRREGCLFPKNVSGDRRSQPRVRIVRVRFMHANSTLSEAMKLCVCVCAQAALILM